MSITEFRKNYLAIRRALPWLDVWRPAELGVPFEPEQKTDIPYIRLPRLAPGTKPDAKGLPLLVKATDYKVDAMEELVKSYPDRVFLYASGDRKLIYDFYRLCQMAKDYPNFYICTANFAPVQACVERVCDAGLAGKLIYGSGLPFFDEDISMGPVIMSNLPWDVKCAIAGNNLRKLLGEAEQIPPEVPLAKIAPFAIDVHTHSCNTPCDASVRPPAWDWRWKEWKQYFDLVLTKAAVITPQEFLHRDWAANPDDSKDLQDTVKMCQDSNGHLFFYCAFDPNQPEISGRHITKALACKECKGIKIHPPVHKTYADDDRYEFVYQEASRTGKAILTHSWEISSYNPTQKFSVPTLFEKYFKKYPDAKFILGHAGGRPSTMKDVCRILNTYKNVHIDISGDYFHAGFIRTIVQGAGSDKIMLGSDAYWFDARSLIGMLLASPLTDMEVEKILYLNAEKFYGI